MHNENLPSLAITMGDPAGVGPEIILKALQNPEVYTLCRPVIYGDIMRMRFVAREMLLTVSIFPEDCNTANPHIFLVHQAAAENLTGIKWGKLSAAAGKAAAESVIAAAKSAMAGGVAAIVTAPLNKEAMAMGGYPYPGHTELLAAVTRVENYGMLLVTDRLRVIHVSTHVSLQEAIARVKTPRILSCIRLGQQACRELGIAQPRIAVAGLNPHAGENGLFGTEDADEIAPAVLQAKSEDINASGPYPPDTLFARAAQGIFDLVVAMYHDQGHIPVKLQGFDTGVNITIGLPIIRVSVDHGTAFDIAGKGVAREDSLLQAIRVAAQMVRAKENA